MIGSFPYQHVIDNDDELLTGSNPSATLTKKNWNAKAKVIVA